MTQPNEIELTETSPGSWEFLLRLPGSIYRRARPERRGWDAKRQAFFDSLESEPAPLPDHTWRGFIEAAIFLAAFFCMLPLLIIIVLGPPPILQ